MKKNSFRVYVGVLTPSNYGNVGKPNGIKALSLGGAAGWCNHLKWVVLGNVTCFYLDLPESGSGVAFLCLYFAMVKKTQFIGGARAHFHALLRRVQKWVVLSIDKSVVVFPIVFCFFMNYTLYLSNFVANSS